MTLALAVAVEVLVEAQYIEPHEESLWKIVVYVLNPEPEVRTVAVPLAEARNTYHKVSTSWIVLEQVFIRTRELTPWLF